MEYEIVKHTEVGLVKKRNEDAILVIEKKINEIPIVIAIVCDGMGGLSNGDYASQYVKDIIEKWFLKNLQKTGDEWLAKDNIENEVIDIIYESNTQLFQEGVKNGRLMGTTLTSIVLYKNKYFISHVGDSKAIKLTDNIFQLTKDHTLLQKELDNGNLTKEQAIHYPKKNVLINCIGASEKVSVDFYNGLVETGDAYLLCSDGFMNMLLLEEIYIKVKACEATGTLTFLSDLAKLRGERDNISAILIKVI